MSALGALFGGAGGGGAAPPDAGGGDPQALLQQITQLMQQYLTLGPDTPAYQTISEALPAIEEASDGGVEETPDTDDGPGGEAAEDMGGGSPMDTMQPSSPPSSFGDASTQALDALKKRGKGKAY